MNKKKKIIGVENVAYQSKKSGRDVSGVRLHIASEIDSTTGIGYSVESVFISGGKISDYPLKEITTVLYEPTFAGQFRCVGVIYSDTK